MTKIIDNFKNRPYLSIERPLWNGLFWLSWFNMRSENEILVKNYFPTWDRFTKTLIGLLCACILISIIAFISNFSQLSLLNILLNSSNEIDALKTSELETALYANDSRQMFIYIVYLIFYYISCIVFLIWIYRSNHNCRHLGAKGLESSPGWAVGWFFIPICSLWMPYDSLKEIWQSSIDPENWKNVKINPLLLIWWLTFISLSYTVLVLNIFIAPEKENIIILTKISIAYSIISIFIYIINIIIIQSIYKAQMINFQRLEVDESTGKQEDTE